MHDLACFDDLPAELQAMVGALKLVAGPLWPHLAAALDEVYTGAQAGDFGPALAFADYLKRLGADAGMVDEALQKLINAANRRPVE